MSWASQYIEQLKQGQTVSFKPTGNSMSGRVESGSLVTVRPLNPGEVVANNSVVLCSVGGNHYLHLVKSRAQDGRYQIGNNHGKINGWTWSIHGVMISNA